MADQLKECQDQTRCRCGYRSHVAMGENQWKLRRLNDSERQQAKWNIHDLKLKTHNKGTKWR